MSDHDGHTINVGPVTVGETLARPPVENLHAVLWGPRVSAVVDRLRAENTALAAALADIADGECMSYDAVRCWELDPADPDEWCPVCVAEVAWCAWKMGALR